MPAKTKKPEVVQTPLDSTLETLEDLLGQGIGGKKYPQFAAAVREARIELVGKDKVEAPKTPVAPPSNRPEPDNSPDGETS